MHAASECAPGKTNYVSLVLDGMMQAKTAMDKSATDTKAKLEKVCIPPAMLKRSCWFIFAQSQS